MKHIVVFCGSSLGFNTIYKKAAEELGFYFVKHNLALVYGGGKIGLMGALADAVIANKGHVFGIIPQLLHKDEVVHTGATKITTCKTMSERKVIMSKLADAYIALPGGFGTLDELFEVLTLGQLHIEQKPIGILNTNGFFNPVLHQLDQMVAEGFLKEDNKNMLIVANSVDELMTRLNTYKKPSITTIINKVVTQHDHKL